MLSKWYETFENQGAAVMCLENDSKHDENQGAAVTCLANDTKHPENQGAAVTCLASDTPHQENRSAELTRLVNRLLVAIWLTFQTLKSSQLLEVVWDQRCVALMPLLAAAD